MESYISLLANINFCESTWPVWQLLGLFILILKIVLPLIIIIWGIVLLVKAVISSDEKAISKAIISLLKRFVAGIVVFFIPTIVNVIFNYVVGVTDSETNKNCMNCLTSPYNKCDTSYQSGAFWDYK